MGGTEDLFCDSCDIALKPAKTHFTYLGHAFQTELPRCPKCGQVFITEDLVKGRMAQVEMELEDK